MHQGVFPQIVSAHKLFPTNVAAERFQASVAENVEL